jgi:hypothetical protein
LWPSAALIWLGVRATSAAPAIDWPVPFPWESSNGMEAWVVTTVVGFLTMDRFVPGACPLMPSPKLNSQSVSGVQLGW